MIRRELPVLAVLAVLAVPPSLALGEDAGPLTGTSALPAAADVVPGGQVPGAPAPGAEVPPTTGAAPATVPPAAAPATTTPAMPAPPTTTERSPSAAPSIDSPWPDEAFGDRTTPAERRRARRARAAAERKRARAAAARKAEDAQKAGEDDAKKDDDARPGGDPLSAPVTGISALSVAKFRIPPFLLPIYQAAGVQYGIRWEVLAAINEIETDYGRNLNISTAGAMGWMQFMPPTWASYGVDANADGDQDPYNPVDAIFAAARYLRAAGGDKDIERAVFAYNHAGWYVDDVMARAKAIAALPADVVSSLTGLTLAQVPVHSPGPKGRDDAGVRVKATKDEDWAAITAPEDAAVVAVQDATVTRIGTNRQLGNYVELRDAYGNRYTYAGLGTLAEDHVVPKRRATRDDDAGKESDGKTAADDGAKGGGDGRGDEAPADDDAQDAGAASGGAASGGAQADDDLTVSAGGAPTTTDPEPTAPATAGRRMTKAETARRRRAAARNDTSDGGTSSGTGAGGASAGTGAGGTSSAARAGGASSATGAGRTSSAAAADDRDSGGAASAKSSRATAGGDTRSGTAGGDAPGASTAGVPSLGPARPATVANDTGPTSARRNAPDGVDRSLAAAVPQLPAPTTTGTVPTPAGMPPAGPATGPATPGPATVPATPGTADAGATIPGAPGTDAPGAPGTTDPDAPGTGLPAASAAPADSLTSPDPAWSAIPAWPGTPRDAATATATVPAGSATPLTAPVPVPVGTNGVLAPADADAAPAANVLAPTVPAADPSAEPAADETATKRETAEDAGSTPASGDQAEDPGTTTDDPAQSAAAATTPAAPPAQPAPGAAAPTTLTPQGGGVLGAEVLRLVAVASEGVWLAGLPVEEPAADESSAGSETEAPEPSEKVDRLDRYIVRSGGLRSSDVRRRPLEVGSRVLAGSVLGRTGSSSMRLAIRPAGKGAPRIDPRPIVAGWRLLDDARVFSDDERGELVADAAEKPGVGRLLLMSKEQLQARVLANGRLTIYPAGREDIRTGQIDRRILATLEYLVANGHRLTITSLKGGRSSILSASGNVSAHSYGAAVDIAAVDGIPIMGNQGAGSITDKTNRLLLRLQGTMKPNQIISLMTYPGTDNTLAMGDHDDHIHVGFPRDPGAGGGDARLGAQVAAVLKPAQWDQLVSRLAEIDNPTVRRGVSKAATPAKKAKGDGRG